MFSYLRLWATLIIAILIGSPVLALQKKMTPALLRKPTVVSPHQEIFFRETLLGNLAYPWAMEFLPNDNILINEHAGKLLLLDASKHVSEIHGLPDNIAAGAPQLGLLDIAVSPSFTENRKIYISYVASKETIDGNLYTTCLIRANLNLSLGTLEKNGLKGFCVSPWGKETSQFGGALALDQQGHIFLSVGDRAQRDVAQHTDAQWGKILRLNDNLTKPQDNPYYGKNGGFIWSIGHRNPQGLYFDTQSQSLYEAEHGPHGGDEINIIGKGKNYGWPVITYGREYDTNEVIGDGIEKSGMEQPVYYYVPSIGTSAIVYYHGIMFPEWKNSIFVGALGGWHLNHIYLKNGRVVREERLLRDLESRIRDVKVGPGGALYVLLEQGSLLRLSHKFTLRINELPE